MITGILTVEIRYEHDIVLARQRARQIAELLRFERQDQVRVATAVSELARNAFQYAARGRVEFQIAANRNSVFQIKVSDRGPGISNLPSILEGNYQSQTGMGLGLVGVRRLMDTFSIDAPAGHGTTVVIGKELPAPEIISTKFIASIGEELARRTADNPFEEVLRQNKELLTALDELQNRQTQLDQVNRELEETNRGVVALYAELDEKAEAIRRASEVKSRFLSNITHELRTPLISISGLARCLLDGGDGELNAEHKKQVTYIKQAANNLAEMVNDLLDLAKLESGKSTVNAASLEISDMLGALRGMFRPLSAVNPNVELIFEEPDGVSSMQTDESKLSQILRNLISNALKYTERGEIRVSAVCETPGWVTFSVADTGIGIARENQVVIFEEFVQLEGPHQNRFKGTGLGLSVSRKLVELLGGYMRLESEYGVGSTFAVYLPIQPDNRLPSPRNLAGSNAAPRAANKRLPAVLIIDDEASDRAALKKILAEKFRCLEAASGVEGIQIARNHLPAAILLDVAMPDLDGFAVLEKLKEDEKTSRIPVIIHTSRDLTEGERAGLQNRCAGILKKNQALPKLWDILRDVGIQLAGETETV